MSNQDAVPITRSPLFFQLHRKKEHRNREILRCCIDTHAVLRRIVVFTFSSGTRLASWIPDNGKNLVPCRTIDRRHFQREDRFFVSRFAHDAFRFRPYPSASLHRLIFCSFSSVSYSTSSTPVLWTRSVHRKDLFLRSTTQPFVLLYSLVESLRSSVFYFKFRESQCNQGCRPISWIWEKPADWNVRNNRKESVQNSKLENSSFFQHLFIVDTIVVKRETTNFFLSFFW